ncbi:EamA family transporter [Acinetobacter sp. ANC 4558]|uniref:DMT family transporter n=1 Tax=Acinetobacter sp. ANC 4558 TaxID=1977876 RepID=UPI000A342BCA|nr:DMT family transporter [Acinetobacter sp. ANC 4558]OTG82535.1 EamA family transporter [Acinetobacter sp. ANC 4558]
MNKSYAGWIYGLMGVLIFSGSLPATRLAIVDFSPEFSTFARASIAGIISFICLVITHQKIPNLQQFKSIAIVSCGVVVGFPLFSAFALQSISTARAIVFTAMLPLSTAIFAVLRAKELPQPKFWLFAILGSLFVAGFMLLDQQYSSLQLGDFYMLIAIIVCGLAYAEGGKLSRELKGWQVICWALITALPFMLVLSFYYLPHKSYSSISILSMIGLLYISLFSMFIGFFFWYKGLALGGIAQIGQIQLIQPFLGLILSAWLLHEKIELSMLIVCILVIICIMMAKKYA